MEHYFKKKIKLPYPENDYCYVLNMRRTDKNFQITEIAGIYTDWNRLERAVDYYFEYKDIDYPDVNDVIEFFVTTERFNPGLLKIYSFTKN